MWDVCLQRKHSSYMPVSRAYGIDTEQIHGRIPCHLSVLGLISRSALNSKA